MRKDREGLNETWLGIKHSKLGHERLALSLRQAKKGKPLEQHRPVSIESQVQKSLQRPIFGEPAAKILGDLLDLTDFKAQSTNTGIKLGYSQSERTLPPYQIADIISKSQSFLEDQSKKAIRKRKIRQKLL